MKQLTTMERVGQFCKDYRMNVLKMTRKEVAPNTHPQTLAQFENGNSSNFNHFINYFNAGTVDQQLMFINQLTELLQIDDVEGAEFYDKE